MDDLTQAFSRLVTGVVQLPNASFNDQIITHIQKTQLTEARLDMKLSPDHEICVRVDYYCQRWEIPVCAAHNFMFLACGNLKFPILLLQNPSRDHHVRNFTEMVRSCPTLVWLEEVLEGIGLSINDVIILDVCPLLSDAWLQSMTEVQAEKAIKEAYDMIEDILVLLRPELLIACQCTTKSWSAQLGRYASDFVRELGSSWLAAEQKQIVRLQYREHIFNVVQAYHPRSFIGRGGADANKREILLKDILSHFLVPCGKWKAQVTVLLRLDKMLASWLEAMKELDATTNRLLETFDRFAAKLSEKSSS